MTSRKLDEVIQSGEELLGKINQLDIEQLEHQLPDFLEKSKHYVTSINKQRATQSNLDRFKKLIIIHNKIVKQVNLHRDNISKELKRLHTGKKMQNSYPQEVR